MKADFGFLEYSFNPDNTSYESVFGKLSQLGFVNRAKHRSGYVTVWTQNNSILMIRETFSIDQPELTGLGFLATPQEIQQLGCQHDPETDLWVKMNNAGLRSLFIDTSTFTLDASSLINYETVNNKSYSNPGLKIITGIKYNCCDPKMMNFYQSIGFKFTRSTEQYDTLVSSNNRFTILCSKTQDDKKIRTVIADTDDVFHTTGAMIVAGIDLKKFNTDDQELNFGSLNHKITGYNCLAFGNKESYTIENFIPDAAPGLDVIFRTRKQYLHITGNTLDTHYEQLQNA